jgi:hypothetical protein
VNVSADSLRYVHRTEDQCIVAKSFNWTLQKEMFVRRDVGLIAVRTSKALIRSVNSSFAHLDTGSSKGHLRLVAMTNLAPGRCAVGALSRGIRFFQCCRLA